MLILRCLCITLLIALSHATGIYAQEWHWINPTTTADNLVDVQFLDECAAFAVGENGTVLKTLNGGKDWFIVYSDSEYRISAFHGVDINNLWLIGIRFPQSPPFGATLQIRRSIDGGKNWTVMFESDSSEGGQYKNYALRDIFFVNSSTGWAVGDSGLVLKTEDAGSNWSGSFLPTEHPLHQIIVLNASQAFASGGTFYLSLTQSDTSFSWGELFKTNDGGNSWIPVYQDSIFFDDVFLGDASNAWAAASKISIDQITGNDIVEHYILKSTNGGVTWNEATITGGIGFAWPTDIYFIDQDNGFATGFSGSTFRSQDGGDNWDPLNILERSVQRLHRVDFATEYTGIVVGADGAITRTEDGGQSWNQIDEKPILSDLRRMEFTSLDTGWVAGNTLYHTTNAGVNWTDVGIYGIYDVDFPSKDNGWIVGLNGQIWNTSDGGNSWDQQTQPTTEWLQAVAFYDKNIGWAAGQNVILNTVNGGQSWEVQFSGTGGRRIFISDSLKVWISGAASGIPLRTSNGGQTWEEHSSIYPVFFLDNEIGWGRRGSEFYFTSDGGATWEARANIFGSHQGFIDTLQGWSVGGSQVFQTQDGGFSWEQLLESGNNFVHDIDILDAEHGWIIGSGMILRYGYPEYFTPSDTLCNPLGIKNMTPPLIDRKVVGKLGQNSPNPFNSSTSISFELFQSGNTSVVIYDLLGRKVFNIKLGHLNPGQHTTIWNGQNSVGQSISSGVYFYQLIVSNGAHKKYSQRKKLHVIK